MGEHTSASGSMSTAMGYYSTAESYASLAIGQYNVGGGTADSWVPTDPLFEIGNGSGSSSKANALTVLKNGNVGIGTATPGYPLEVAGQVKVTGGSPGAGKVLTSDAAGLASWESLAGSGWTSDTGVVYTTTPTDKVGIGPSSPSSQLDVAGDIETGSSNAIYLGDPSTDGTWRIVRNGNYLVFERRESGGWVMKGSFSA
jgi:hypothetical protein